MIKKYLQYIKESITTDIDDLLNSIKEKKVDFYSIGLSNDNYINKSIDFIYDEADFNKKLFEKELKKGEIESTIDIENFLRKDIDIKFFFLYDRDNSILDDPEYLILQYYKNDKWNPIEIYLIKGDVDKFYEKLTAKTIKLTKDEVTYIYYTSNSGNNWILKNKEKKNTTFKENLETDDIKNLIRNGSKLKIID